VGDARSFTKFQAATGTRILFSTKFGRVSYEDDEFQQGVFSHYLVEGLRGAAAKEDGWVSFRDLSDYVTEQVQTRTLQQGHTQVPFEGTGQSDASGDFPVARLAGGGGPVAVEPTQPVARASSGRIKENSKDGQRYVWIPAGSYLMGCSAGDSECYDNEKPPHSVTISKGFWMGQTAVTVGAWKRYRQATGTAELPKEDSLGRKNWNEAGADNMPAVMMTWDEASSFCKWANMRLPTEAEWEYAARAGTTGARYGELDSVAWYGDNSGNQRIDSTQVWQADKAGYAKRLFENGNFVHAVAQKQPNAWKLYDMLGNVYQWTADWYDASYYAKGEGEDPIGPPAGQYRVLRGGSWYGDPRDVRLSGRSGDVPGGRNYVYGCRCGGELP
jgi:formylglycine-generating enzyme required for sulfatase activity